MTDDINDVSHTSTYAKAEEAIRKDERSRISPAGDTTLYVDRSEVRGIVIGHNAATQAVLSQIDALPIFTASDFRSPDAAAAPSNAIVEESMWMLQDVPGDTLVQRIARLSKWYQDLCGAAQPAAIATVEQILRDHFYTGEPGQHEAIQAAVRLLCVRGHAQKPKEPHERTYMRGWNEAAEECALLAERLGEECASNASRVAMSIEIANAIRALSDTSTDRHGDNDPRCNCGHLFELCPQADCTAISPLTLPSPTRGLK